MGGAILLVVILVGETAAPRTFLHSTPGPLPASTTTTRAPDRAALGLPLTMTPSADLVDREPVTVAGSGFPGGTLVATAECVPGPVDLTTCDLGTLVTMYAPRNGSFSVNRFVQRIITTTASGSVDCATAVGACRMVAANYSQYAENGSLALAFSRSGPPVTAPTVQVAAAPSTGLVDGKVIKVTGSGVLPYIRVQVVECVAGSAPGPTTCQLSITQFSNADAAGRFTITWAVHRILQLAGPGHGTTFDCASRPYACLVVAGTLSDHGSTPVDFKP
jgi:hypothetical protein